MVNADIPLVDLHRHLDGNIHPKTIWELAQQHNLELPATSLQELAPLTQIQDQTSDLLAFLQKLDYGVSVLADLDACYRVALENMQDARNQGINYTELRFSPYYMAQAHNLNVADVTAAVIDGVADGAKAFGVKANLIGILSRTNGAEACQIELEGLLAHKDKIKALDLAGDELNFPAELFREHFRQGRDAGWEITVHAGEADGPQSIWKAIEMLGATRIGHGVAAIQDPKLMEYMAKNQIAVESCPTSNYQTATVKDLQNHPMATFIENGMLVTLNTDDPAVSNITLPGEYQVATDTLGLSADTLRQVQENGLKAAFLSESEVKELKANHIAYL